MAIQQDLTDLLGPNKSWSVTTGGNTPTAPKYEQVNPTLQETEGQKKAREYLSNSLTTGATPYDTSNRVADLPYEQQIRGQLESYAGREAPALYGQAENVLSNTLTGGYDPNTSQYYQGMRESAQLNNQDALNQYGRQQYLTGNLRSTPTDVGQARLIAEQNANMNTLLGQLANQERGYQVQGINQAMQLGQLQDRMGADTLGAYAQISPLLQQTEQAQKDAEYQEFLRQQNYGIDISKFLMQTPVKYTTPHYRQVDTNGNIIGV
jgi:hypothetical protein